MGGRTTADGDDQIQSGSTDAVCSVKNNFCVPVPDPLDPPETPPPPDPPPPVIKIPRGIIVGNLIANKTVINEFFAFSMMKDVVGQLSEKGKLIATFALCGFANFSSIGIQIGGIGGLAPTRKSDIARLGFRALLAGSLVSFMTACIAGLIWEIAGAPVK